MRILRKFRTFVAPCVCLNPKTNKPITLSDSSALELETKDSPFI